MEPVREQILNLQHISYTYHTLQGETLALSDISFSLKKGEFAAIVGPSGCGKSTLLSLICGLLPCTEGQIKINGKPLKESTTNVGYMLQHDELFEWRTIYNNVILGLEVQHALTARTKQRAHELLDIYGLGDFKNARPSELSGGMRQRAALIRTLVLEPELLLLDEPFSALDYQTRLQVGDDIGQIIRNEGKSALLVTHDLSEAISLADRVIVLSNRPATMMVVRVAPSHTMRSGARADFGRLFRTTRYGSRISESFLLNHRSTAVRILKTITRRKLTIVSYKVTPRCRKILRSATMSRKHRAILEGLLKIKESMI